MKVPPGSGAGRSRPAVHPPASGIVRKRPFPRDNQDSAVIAVRVAARPNIKAYLESDRRIAFNEQGIFRRYKELDR